MMETIKDYLETQVENHFLGSDRADIPDFILQESFQRDIKDYMLVNYWNFILRKRFSDDMAVIPNICNIVYRTNAYKFKTLYETTQLVYNPIENYSMVEEGKDTNSGNDVTTYNKGAQENSENIGTRTDNSTVGKNTTTAEHEVSPFESSSYTPESKDTATTADRNDSFTQGSQNNNYTDGAREDKTDLQHGHVLEHNLKRSGNVGVTTSQQMILSERNIADFSMVKEVARELVRVLCIEYYRIDS